MSQRALRAGLVALCVVAQLTTTAHQLLVQHTFCVAHGELVDGPRAARLTMGHANPSQGPAASDSHEEPGVRAHSHCGLAVDRSGRIGAPAPSSIDIPFALFSACLPPLARAERAPGGGVLSLAPKTSPPA